MGIFQKVEFLNKTKECIKTTFITLYNFNYAIDLDKNRYWGKFSDLIKFWYFMKNCPVELAHPLLFIYLK